MALLLADQTVALIFEKPSTRTRVSFETGVARLGGTPLTMNAGDLQLGRGETVEDTALVLSRYVDAIVIRSGSHERVEELARHATVPVINALTPLHHPCQALADAQTLAERFGELRALPVAYVGDGNNVFHSLAVVAAHTGLRLTCASPEGYRPDPEIVAWADAAARDRDGWVRVVADPREAATGAKAVYTDVWVSMGDEEERVARARGPRELPGEHRADGRGGDPMGSPCTAFPRTTARRSRARSPTAPARRSGMRPRTASTHKPRSWRSSWRASSGPPAPTRMFPLHDDNPTRRLPILTLGLIAANVAVFCWQLSLSNAPELDNAFPAQLCELGVVPDNLIGGSSSRIPASP